MNGTVEEITFWEGLWLPELQIFWAVMAFVYGLFLGSFLNVCIYRIPAGLSVLRPKRSFCFRCGSMIRSSDNIPIISYFLLRGRCRSCGSPYSARYMMVELLTGVMFLAVFLAFNPHGCDRFAFGTFWYLAFISMMIVASFTDIDTWIIPDGLTLGGTVVALVAALLIGFVDPYPLLAVYGPFPVIRVEGTGDLFMLMMSLFSGPVELGYEAGHLQWWEPLVNALLGAAFGSGLLYGIGVAGRVFLRRDAMGMGDVKLFALIGATLGITGTVLTLFLASILGAIGGITGKLVGRLWKDEPSILQTGPETLPATGASDDGTPGQVERIAEIARHIPRSHQIHHLPFGPWIALGAVICTILHEPLMGLMRRWLF